jgi:UPF0755 protein
MKNNSVSLMKKLLTIIVIAVLLIWGMWRIWYGMALRPVDRGDTSRVSVTIPSGASTTAIADILEEKNVIRSSYAFGVYAKRADKASTLQAGTFVLQPSMTTPEVVAALSSGETQEMSVTIPEGFTVKDIDALLAAKGLITEGEIIDCANTCDFESFDFLPSGTNQAERGGKLEGYLYPDTYFVASDNFVPKFFLERMLGTFRTKVVNGMADDIEASGKPLRDIITMASLIEEETRTDDERTIVSGILWKRINEGIGLYVDASNRYILDKPTATITATDLNMDSPYNLRKFNGLPPGPIANPSIASIEAAMNPESSPYYYYLHGTDGVIRYAVTNDEHNANKARYLR